MKPLPNLTVLASGSKTGGGSGFQKLVEATQTGILQARITVVSNYDSGGVREKAERLGIRFIHFPGPWEPEGYRDIVAKTEADFVALSGWVKLVKGLDPRTTCNIHPGPLPDFGGHGLYGHFVHEALIAAYKKATVTHSAVCMHFVTEEYDRGPVFFRKPVEILPDDTADTLGTRVNKVEHEYQATITDMVVNRLITWDGVNPQSLVVPDGYPHLASQ